MPYKTGLMMGCGHFWAGIRVGVLGVFMVLGIFERCCSRLLGAVGSLGFPSGFFRSAVALASFIAWFVIV